MPSSAGQAHAHKDIQISLPLRGSYAASWETEGGRMARRELSPGTLLVSTSQQPHAINISEETELAAVWLPVRLMAEAADDLNLGTAEITQTGPISDPLLHALCVSVLAELRQPSPSRLYLDSAAHLLAAHLLRCSSAPAARYTDETGGLPPRRLRRVLAYIHDNLDQDIALADLAGEAGPSVSRFGPLFRQSVGTAPYQYVLAQRIERAKTLLVRGRHSVGEIAAEVGFCDQSQFTRQFKKHVGQTPTAYADHSQR